MSTACGTNTHPSGVIILLKYLSSKTIAFRVMPLILQLHPVMMSIMNYIKVFARRQ